MKEKKKKLVGTVWLGWVQLLREGRACRTDDDGLALGARGGVWEEY